MGGVFRGPVWGGGGGGGGGGVKLPRLKLVRMKLEAWNFVRNYTHICSFRKYAF